MRWIHGERDSYGHEYVSELVERREVKSDGARGAERF